MKDFIVAPYADDILKYGVTAKQVIAAVRECEKKAEAAEILKDAQSKSALSVIISHAMERYIADSTTLVQNVPGGCPDLLPSWCTFFKDDASNRIARDYGIEIKVSNSIKGEINMTHREPPDAVWMMLFRFHAWPFRFYRVEFARILKEDWGARGNEGEFRVRASGKKKLRERWVIKLP